jgi:hypothetical protein
LKIYGAIIRPYLDPDCEELLKRMEPVLMKERDPACEGKAEDHDK